MTSAERVMATVQGLPVDRRAFTATLSLYGARLTGCPLPTYYTDAGAYADGQAAVWDEFGPDVLITPFLAAALAEALGSETRYFQSHPPNLRRPVLRGADEIGSLAVPDVDAHPRLVYLRECVRRMRSIGGGTVPIAAVLIGPTDLAPLCMGAEAWLDALVFRPDVARAVLDVLCPLFVRLANAMLADGAALVISTGAFATPPTVAPRFAEITTLPALRACLPEVRGPVLLHHGGAPLLPALPLVRDLPQVVGYVAGESDDLCDMRDAIGPGRLLVGGIDGPSLPARTPTEVREQCQRAVESRVGDPCFLLGTGAADVPLDTPEANVHAIAEAVGRDRRPSP